MKFRKLQGKIKETFETQGDFAAAMGLSQTTITAKVKGRIDWKQTEMRKACELLGIPIEKVYEYFF